MFGIDWGNPDTLLINLINLGLGITVILAAGWIILSVCIDVVSAWERSRRRAMTSDGALVDTVKLGRTRSSAWMLSPASRHPLPRRDL